MIDRKIESALILVGVMALGGWTGWARTEVTTRLEVEELCIRARCFEPAVKQLDFKHEVPDFIWGNDSVEFFVDDGSGVRVMKRGLLDAICRDDWSWICPFP